MKKTNVIVNGAHGRMGQVTCRAIEDSNDFTLAARCDQQDDLATKIASTAADIVIDFTHANVGFANAEAILNAGARPVIGTSGFLPEQVSHLQEMCTAKKIGAVIAPNFSIAAVLMMQFATQAVKHFPDCEIIEMHHDQKLDAPSGTAMKTCEMIAAHRQQNPRKDQTTHEAVSGSRGASYCDIPVHAVRLPGLVAHQQVLFGAQGELLTLRHDSMNRDGFMPGVLLACREVMKRNELIYGLEHLI